MIATRRIVNEHEDKPILIMDTGADQCTCGGPAWIVLDSTGEEVRCNGWMKGDEKIGRILPIVSAVTCVDMGNGDPFILVMHQACYYDNPDQIESLALPYQAEKHGVTFDLTPLNRLNANGENGQQKMTIEGRDIPFGFDGRKMFLKTRTPAPHELRELESFELTSPEPFVPDNDLDEITTRRKPIKRVYKKYPGGLSMQEWRNRLALAPEDVVRKTFDATTQMAMKVEAETRAVPRRHYKSRFPFLREKRVNDTFHSDTFSPSIHGQNGEKCSQLFLGKRSDYMSVHPIKSESHAYVALQDFGRKVGIPAKIKTDNASTEVGEKWTSWCREYCVDTSFTEPHSPWQNISEQGIGDLGRMVMRCMRAFDVPLNRHTWCQKWCSDVRNILASRKLEWRTSTERLTGNTPDISMFRYHIWQQVEYYEPTVKQPQDGWKPARFLGIIWDSGDALTFFIEPEGQRGRPLYLTRSTIRPMHQPDITPVVPSGETDNQPSLRNSNVNIDDQIDKYIEDAEQQDHNQAETEMNDNDEDTRSNTESENNRQSEQNNNLNNDAQKSNNDDNNSDEISIEDNNLIAWDEVEEDDDAYISEEIANNLTASEEDFEFDQITAHKWEEGLLIVKVELKSGKDYEVPFHLLKKDRPLELAKYIEREVIETKRGGKYETWAKNIFKRSNRTIRR